LSIENNYQDEMCCDIIPIYGCQVFLEGRDNFISKLNMMISWTSTLLEKMIRKSPFFR